MEEGNQKKTSADGGHVENNGKKAEEKHLASIDVGHSKSDIMAHHAVSKEDFMFAVTKKDGGTESFSLKKISNAIVKAFMRIKDNEEEQRPETEEKAEKESPLGLKDDEKEELRSEIAREKLISLSDADLEKVFNPSFVDEYLLGGGKKKLGLEPKARRRGRPRITRLLDKISDSSVCRIFSNIMKKLRITAQWLTQFIVCFLASIGRFFKVDIYGRTEHYRQMLAAHLAGWSLPSTRAIQKGYNWLCNKMDQLKDAAKEKLKRSQWEGMCDEITALLGLELQTMTAK